MILWKKSIKSMYFQLYRSTKATEFASVKFRSKRCIDHGNLCLIYMAFLYTVIQNLGVGKFLFFLFYECF